MPFVSEAQRRYMYAKHPEIAERWQQETPDGALPEHVESDAARKERLRRELASEIARRSK